MAIIKRFSTVRQGGVVFAGNTLGLAPAVGGGGGFAGSAWGFPLFSFLQPYGDVAEGGYFRPRRNFNIAPFLRHFQATAGCKSLSQQTVARRIRLFAGKLVVGQHKPVESALQKGYNTYIASLEARLRRRRSAVAEWQLHRFAVDKKRCMIL